MLGSVLNFICVNFNRINRIVWCRFVLLVLFFSVVGCTSPSKTVVQEDIFELADISSAPHFQLKSLSMRNKTLDHYTSSESVVMIYFWASWNQESVDDLVYIQDFYDDFSPSGLKVVAINIEGQAKRNKVSELISNYGYDFDVLIDDGENWQAKTFNAYNVKSIPRIILIDKQGNVRVNRHTDQFSINYIKVLLKE